MKRLFAEINPKPKNKLSKNQKEKFEKIEKDYDSHDDGYISEENKITHKRLSKQLQNKEQQEINETSMSPASPGNN
ncbi:hypothetical protein Lsan_1898 [Legionella santicrucis]|uniref:Uncharacterized protein n=1 Tax=Legionella santicrucis TaxID=45074 RepID=A0A0W0YVW8_9GAMM|nr:hypothetical protein [Legionella santicrucis]KTD61000.1 hypothetical protein Lsan_1898 [Legionella santicrucis]